MALPTGRSSTWATKFKKREYRGGVGPSAFWGLAQFGAAEEFRHRLPPQFGVETMDPHLWRGGVRYLLVLGDPHPPSLTPSLLAKPVQFGALLLGQGVDAFGVDLVQQLVDAFGG